VIRAFLLRCLLGAVCVAMLAVVWTQTEWVEEPVRTPGRGEVLINPYYAVQHLLQKLGGDVRWHTHLRSMPPQNARLLLDHAHWNMFDGRAQALRQWVEAGGHLVIGGWLLHSEALEWLPITSGTSPPVPKNAPVAEEARASGCYTLTEPDGIPASYTDTRPLNYCPPSGAFQRHLVPASNQHNRPLWQVVNVQGGAKMMRMPYGKGSVTVLQEEAFLDNDYVLQGDNALLAASVFQVEPGAGYWFVTKESRQPLLATVWRRLWPAVCLALLALAAFVWRSAVRFGPVLPPLGMQRRSMREQVHGTGHFLLTHGAEALHAAQLRALHETASRYVPDWATMDTAARSAALAQTTGLPADVLARALQPGLRHSVKSMQASASALSVLERARRRLHATIPSTTHSHATYTS